MRLVIWNCNMSFRKKIDLIGGLDPDLAVIPEAEYSEKWYGQRGRKPLAQNQWFGQERNRGLGLYTFGKWRMSVHESYDPREPGLVPLTMREDDQEFLLLAVAAARPRKQTGPGAVFPLLEKLADYATLFAGQSVIVAGDFACTALAGDGAGGYGDLRDLLGGHGLYSCYHAFSREAPGREGRATRYPGRIPGKGVHEAFCFASSDWLIRLCDVQVGEPDQWLDQGEQMPLVVDFE